MANKKNKSRTVGAKGKDKSRSKTPKQRAKNKKNKKTPGTEHLTRSETFTVIFYTLFFVCLRFYVEIATTLGSLVLVLVSLIQHPWGVWTIAAVYLGIRFFVPSSWTILADIHNFYWIVRYGQRELVTIPIQSVDLFAYRLGGALRTATRRITWLGLFVTSILHFATYATVSINQGLVITDRFGFNPIARVGNTMCPSSLTSTTFTSECMCECMSPFLSEILPVEFDSFDRNGDGRWDMFELMDFSVHHSGFMAHSTNILAMFATLDGNNDMLIAYPEFEDVASDESMGYVQILVPESVVALKEHLFSNKK